MQAVTDAGGWHGPGSEDIQRWRERQRRFAELDRHARSDDVDVVPITRLLAELLWDLHDDGQLWKLLKRDQRVLERLDDVRRVRLLATAEIDWAPFLVQAGYVPPPPIDYVADELRVDVRRSIRNPDAADAADLRRRVARLASSLDKALADVRPSGLRRVWAMLRSYSPVARRGAIVSGTSAAIGAGAGALVNPLVGAAAGGAARAGLDRALPKVTVDEPATTGEVRRVIRDHLRLDLYGRARADFDSLADVAE